MSKELNKAPVEQTGGDERVAFEKIHTVPRGIMWNEEKSQYVRVHEKHCSLRTWNSFVALWAGWMARAALAQPSPVINYALLHAYACENSIDYNALCATVRDSLEQPSPAPDIDPLNLAPHAGAFNEAPAEALKPEPAEAERPEVVAWQYRVTAGPQTGWSLWHPGKGEEFERSYTVERRPLMTIAQHECIVGELRAVIAQLRQHKNDYMDSGQETYRALQNEIREREAEIARLDGLVSGRTAERDAALSEVERLTRDRDDCLKARLHYATQHGLSLARVAELTATRNRYGVDAHYFNKNLQRILREFESFTPDELARSLIILAKVADEKVVAQAQHSVPDGYRLIRLEHFAAIKAQLDPKQVDAYRGRNIYDEDKVYANWNECRSALDEIKDVFQQIDWDAENELAELLAAAPGKSVPQAWLDVQAERRRQVEAEGWTPEHDDAHSYGQMARAAACYALAGSSAPNDGTAALLVSLAWPWDEQWWKPTSTRRDLVKACALALAEIERLDRAAAPGKEGA
ncbi:hypothetical protein [Pseudomonas paraeruginosa]|uniref:hypothetical protein n=1 Tax=Pseudomonas paraeruginosa TaxID=2994495 RepID=UPI0039FC3493